MIYIRQLLASFLGAAGFSLVFGVYGRSVWVASFGGAACWGIYLAGVHLWGQGAFCPAFLATACTEAYAVGLAKKLKTPTTVLFTPAIVPLIPGSGLYHMMSAVVSREWGNARAYGYDTLLCALGIALGMSVVCAVCVMSGRMKKRSCGEKL